MKILLIANPVAGGDARPRIRRAAELLAARGATVVTVLTSARGDARAAAAAAHGAGYNRIVAAGGDGTLNEVLNGLAPSSIPIAFIPCGTVNVLALELGLPFDLAAACAIARDGVPQTVSLGQAGDEKFLLMAGIGFDAAVVRAVSSRLKRRLGRYAYVVAALQVAWRWRDPQLSVTPDDGVAQPAAAVIVGNGRLYGGRYSLTPGACLTDPHFEVLLLRPGLGPLLRTAARMVCQRPVASGDGELLKTTTLRIEGRAPLQADGDDLGTTPCTITLLPGAATLMVPPPRS